MKKKLDDVIFGIRAVMEAVEAGKEINRILIQNGLQGELLKELKIKITNKNLVQYVPIEKLNRITRKNHQGVIAFVSPIDYYSIEDELPNLFEQGANPLLLVLDRITDVRNFGAIARSAECMGVHAIVVPSKGGALVGADAIKTSAGALHKIPVCRTDNLKATLHYLKDSGLQLVACTEKSDQFIAAVDFSVPTAIIMGSEENGISPEFLKLSSSRAAVPMTGTIASMNVSVAAGIILYEAVRQRS